MIGLGSQIIKLDVTETEILAHQLLVSDSFRPVTVNIYLLAWILINKMRANFDAYVVN